MARILIVYESKYGQTEKIAKFIVNRMLSQGHSVNLMNLRTKDLQSPANYEGIIVGGGVYMRSYPKSLVKWVQENSRNLSQKPTAFFSVCLAVMQNDLRTQRDLHLIENNFFKKTKWFPKRREAFAGALSYSKYGWLTKRVMKLMAQSRGGDSDTSRDYEYTSWKDVSRFSDNFVNSLRQMSNEMHAP
ncbi:MAG TPA: flavodoxin domain-containing protein [Pseudobdellovibrionaceae bacterium]|jgi:menaquinone-dependent protoporphyrinogen oxidase